MKKFISITVLSLLLIYSATVAAQVIKSADKNAVKGWQNMSFEKDGIYGAEINKAYDFLKGKKIKKQVVVAVIGTGMDIEHEALAKSIWTDPENKNIHGWNYLGNAKGEVLNKISKTGVREFMRLKDKYGDVFPSDFDLVKNLKFYRFNKDKNNLTEVTGIDIDEFRYFQNQVIPESSFGSSYRAVAMQPISKMYLDQMDARIRSAYPDQAVYDTLSQKTVRPFWDEALDNEMGENGLYRASMTVMRFGVTMTKSFKWAISYNHIINKQQPYAIEKLENNMKKFIMDDRKLVGDNYLDIEETKYGNDVLLTEDAGLGTIIGGIIAADHSMDNDIKGVSANVQLMTLRVEVEDPRGEPYLKDVALAIRYAVDHGADIIQMTKGNTLAPADQLKWVNDAMAYAEQKGVLIVQPMEDYAVDEDNQIPFYPRKKISSSKTLTNFITVAASDDQGNPLMQANYGNESLDIFAPGINIYSTFTGDTYRTETGSRLAAAMVTGTAALIKNYYPTLTGSQIKQLLMDNVTSRKGSEVEKSTAVIKRGSISGSQKDLVDFDDLSVSNGILSAYKAIEAASKIK